MINENEWRGRLCDDVFWDGTQKRKAMCAAARNMRMHHRMTQTLLGAFRSRKRASGSCLSESL